MIELSSDQVTAKIDPYGGKLASLNIGGLEVLVTEGAKATRFGSFPMIPWCGRLDQAVLNWNGASHEFEANAGAHANHGFCHVNDWKVVDQSKSSLSMSFDMSPFWSFGGRVTQQFDLSDSSIKVTCSIEADEASFPAMIGWHPWFVRELVGPDGETVGTSSLDFKAEQLYVLKEDLIPTGQLGPVPEGPWDNCFIGVNQNPKISWGDALRLEISSSFDHWVVYTEPEHAFCVEPQSGPPNQPNSDPHTVNPGEAFSGWMEIGW